MAWMAAPAFVRQGAKDRGERRQAAGAGALKRYCGKPQLYQGLVQYTKVKAFCSGLAARSSASSETSKVRISSSGSAWLVVSSFMALYFLAGSSTFPDFGLTR